MPLAKDWRCVIDEEKFNEAYDFNITQIVTVKNPTKKDYAFQITIEVGLDATGKRRTEARHYLVKHGEAERFPGPVAKYYLDQMAKIVAQDRDIFRIYADFQTRAKLYKELIADVEDTLATSVDLEQFRNIRAEVAAPEEEKPFATLSEGKIDGHSSPKKA